MTKKTLQKLPWMNNDRAILIIYPAGSLVEMAAKAFWTFCPSLELYILEYLNILEFCWNDMKLATLKKATTKSTVATPICRPLNTFEQ